MKATTKNAPPRVFGTGWGALLLRNLSELILYLRHFILDVFRCILSYQVTERLCDVVARSRVKINVQKLRKKLQFLFQVGTVSGEHTTNCFRGTAPVIDVAVILNYGFYDVVCGSVYQDSHESE